MKLIRSRILRVAILQCCTHSWKYLQAFVGAAEMSSKLSKRLHGCVDAVTALNDHFASFCKQPLSVKSESTNLDGLLFKNSLRTLCTHAFCLAERCAAFVEKFTNDESSVQLELMKEKFDEFSEIVHDALQCIARCLDNAADVFQECRLSSNESPLLDPFVSLESENSSTENMKLILPEFENRIVDQVFQADTGEENCNLSSECTTAEQQKFDDDQDRAKLQRHLLGELKVVLQGVEKRWRVREQRALGSNSAAAAARDGGSSSSNLGNDVENEKKLINETTNSGNLWTTPARSEFAAQLDKLLSHHISETKQ
ncbi:NADH-quinone oxidoreductase subunit [Trichinella spiralis]|uniref:NADH-quinone oxidoreductase subunit n=1 Tax=Trichinella spiralis TaxID=6334 RepID=A0ABR3KS27_TRISP